MRVLMISEYPRQGEAPSGGVQAAARNLVGALGDMVEISVLDPFADSRGSAADGALRIARWKAPRGVLRNYVTHPCRVARFATRQRADVVHVQGWALLGVALRLFGQAHVVTLHGVRSAEVGASRGWRPRIKSFLLRTIETAVLRGSINVIANSPYIAQIVQAAGCPHIWSIPNAIDPSFFAPRRGHGRNLLFAGRLVPLKRVVEIIEAFAVLARDDDDRRLLIAGAGDSEYEARCRRAARDAGIADRVDFLGVVAAEELARVMDQAGVLVLHSEQENVPMVIAEALAKSLRVVATDVGSIRTMLDGLPGTRVLSRDASTTSLAEALRGALQDPADPREQHARQHAAERYSGAAVAAETMRVYEHVIAGHRARQTDSPMRRRGVVRRG